MATSEAYNMDCLDFMATLQDECVDLTVTSPPYDNMRDYNGYTFDWKTTIMQLYRITKRGGGEWFGSSTIRLSTEAKQAHRSGKHYTPSSADSICMTL